MVGPTAFFCLDRYQIITSVSVFFAINGHKYRLRLFQTFTNTVISFVKELKNSEIFLNLKVKKRDVCQSTRSQNPKQQTVYSDHNIF